MDELRPQLKSHNDLIDLEDSPNPAWVFDMDHRSIWWANKAGLVFWKAGSLAELAERDFSSDSQTAVERLESLSRRVEPGELIRDSWTLYPLGEPTHVMAEHLFVSTPTTTSACLIKVVKHTDTEALRLLEAARNSRFMVSAFDLSGNLLAENPAAANFAMHQPGQGTLAGYLNDTKLAEEVIRQIGKDNNFTCERALSDGSEEKMLKLIARRGRDPVTGSYAIFVTEEDITEQAAAARKLEALNRQLEQREEERSAEIESQEKRYKSLFEHAPDAIVIQDLDDRTIIDANPAAAEAFDLSVDELLNGAYDPFQHTNDSEQEAEEYRETLFQYAQHAFEQGNSSFEFLLRRATGEEFPAQVTMVPFPDDSRRLVRTSIIDLTDRKREQERYQAIFDSADDVIWIADPNDRGFIDWNSKAVELFGATIDEFNDGSLNFFDFSPEFQENGEPSLEIILKYTEQALSGGSPTFEWTFLNREGKAIPCEITLTRFPDPQRRLLRASVRDISEKKAAEQMRIDLENQLAQAQKLESIGHLTGGVAHDFNNLLAVVMGNMELLSNEISDPELQGFIQNAISATERGARITRSMLAFARKSNLKPERFSLANTIVELNDWISSTLPDNIIVTIGSAPELQMIKADFAGAERMLLNLIINARDAMPDGGYLTITAENEGDKVRLIVADTGVGIQPDVINNVFDPYFSTKSMTENSGLGLSMVHGFMKQSGGEVNIRSIPDQGTAVELLFPAISLATTEQPEYGAVSQAGRSHKLRILLVEDQPPVLDVLKRLLTADGHAVSTAISGDQAVAEFGEDTSQFDLLITDVDMPGAIQGHDLAQHVSERHPDLRVILLSGYTPESREQGARNQLMLQKPVAREDLLAAISRLTKT